MKKSKPLLIEGVDFYYNKMGVKTLTAEYYLKRGYCCGRRCRHCPFNKPGKIQCKR